MGRGPHFSKDGLNKGAWTSEEDKILTDYVKIHGEGKWSNVAKKTGLKRCGKSCRLRWMNYLRPDIKRGNISLDEEELIVRLHKLLGNRWSLIAGRLPGRTDNEIKNFWNTNLAKKAQDYYRLTLPKLDNKLRPLHNEVPPSPPPNGTTKPDSNIITVQHKPENDETLQNHQMINVGPHELNSSVVRSDRIYRETINFDQSCDNVDASPSSNSGDENRCPSDQLINMDFNMDDFCKILDSDFAANSVRALEEDDHEVEVADVASKKLESWSGKSDECAQADQAENSDFMSLISFLDSVPSEWQEII